MQYYLVWWLWHDPWLDLLVSWWVFGIRKSMYAAMCLVMWSIARSKLGCYPNFFFFLLTHLTVCYWQTKRSVDTFLVQLHTYWQVMQPALNMIISVICSRPLHCQGICLIYLADHMVSCQNHAVNRIFARTFTFDQRVKCHILAEFSIVHLHTCYIGQWWSLVWSCNVHRL